MQDSTRGMLILGFLAFIIIGLVYGTIINDPAHRRGIGIFGSDFMVFTPWQSMALVLILFSIQVSVIMIFVLLFRYWWGGLIPFIPVLLYLILHNISFFVVALLSVSVVTIAIVFNKSKNEKIENEQHHNWWKITKIYIALSILSITVFIIG